MTISEKNLAQTTQIQKIAKKLIQKLNHHKYVLTTVESCTGGLLAHSITNIPGASTVFYGGHVTYDNSFKLQLGVPKSLLKKFGAVSTEVASAMALQGLEKMQHSLKQNPSHSLLKPKGFLCIATTGIAGPGGGSPEKPVGLCYIALAMSTKPTPKSAPILNLSVIKYIVPRYSNRVRTKQLFTQQALNEILEALQ